MRQGIVFASLASLFVAAFLGAPVACSSSDSSVAQGGGDAGRDSQAPVLDAGGDASLAGDGGADAGGSDAGGGGLSCDTYCALVTKNCPSSTINAEYTDLATCKAMCAHLTLGKGGAVGGDMTGDTVACRQSHAALAAGNPGSHCKPAGPTGAGTCGASACTAWCTLAVAQCPSVYATQSDCETACAGFTVDMNAGDISQFAGNTFNCRIYHLEAAYSDPVTHCPHIAATPPASGSFPCK